MADFTPPVETPAAPPSSTASGIGHYENFPVASLLLPRRLRPPVIAIYRFARTADDLADEGDAPDAERLAGLQALRDQLDVIEAGGVPSTAMMCDLAETIRTRHLPLTPFHRLLDAFSQDVVVKRYDTFAALLDYCVRSADPIGRLMLELYGASTPQHCAWADSICSGLQIVNFLQDVAIDWDKGRIYLPREDLERFGVREPDIDRSRADERWAALMQFETARARAMLLSGRPLGRAVGGRIGLELRLVVAGGLRILQRIDAVSGDVFHRRPTLGRIDWLAMAARALFW